MIDLLWQSLVTGAITAAGFALYLRLTRGSISRALVPQIVTVGALAAGISFVLRVLF